MLESKGLSGAHVAVIGPTSYNWIVAYFGTAATGSIIVPLATAETVDMNVKLIDFADVDVLVFDEKSKGYFNLNRYIKVFEFYNTLYKDIDSLKVYNWEIKDRCDEDYLLFLAINDNEKYYANFTTFF